MHLLAVSEFIGRNEQFARSSDHGRLTAMPSNRVFLVTCLDPRLEPAGFLGIGVGDAIVLRNPGGRVTDTTILDIALIGFMGEFLGADGPPMEVAVVHHTQCGMGFLANPDFRHGFAERSGIADGELATWAVTDPQATVRHDVERLLASPPATSRLVVSGHVLDLATGLASTTLSIISQTFPDRAARAKAIGAWGAATGVAVAVGPIAGGALLAHYWWGSIFLAMVPVAALTIIGAVLFVPSDRPDLGTPIDLRGLTTSALALVSLVYTIIEAPDRGWSSGRTLLGFAVAAAALAALIVVERRQAHPMLDVTLFSNMRFTAASGAVTLAFFALSGFIFLIILYFQIMRGYSALEAGVRTLPVAACIAVASGLGPVLAVRWGNKLVVSAGLVLVAAGYGWVAGWQTQTTSYRLIVLQMILLGMGTGLSTAPATEAILGVVRPEQAGVGSAVNDATRLIGGTLGVAVLGSVYASLYRTQVDDATAPLAARAAAKASYGAGHAVADALPAGAGRDLLAHADSGFFAGLHAGCTVAAAVCLAGAAIVLAFLPAHPDNAERPIAPSPEEPALGTAA